MKPIFQLQGPKILVPSYESKIEPIFQLHRPEISVLGYESKMEPIFQPPET